MSRRAKIIIIIVLLLLILAAVFWWLFFVRARKDVSRSGQPESVSDSGANVRISDARNPVGTTNGSGRAPGGEQTDLRGFVGAFVERFGSYSNQSDFENVEDLYAFMTRRFQRQMEEYVAYERAKIVLGAPYEGVSTRVLSVSKISEGAGRMVFQARALRATEKSADGTRQEDYQNIELTLQEEGGQWKVDSAKWQ